VRDDITELIAILDDAHQQRNLQPHKTPITITSAYRINSKPCVKGKRKHQQRRGKATDNAKDKLDPHEAIAKPRLI